MLFTPPMNIAKRDFNKKSVFLAGSIEMGKAIDWQADLGEFFLGKGWNVFNPRRADWDSSWVQSHENPQFAQQVRWEWNALKKADLIVMFFSPGTISPISLLEYGAFCTSGKMVVICPEGFHRKGNVDIVAEIEDIPLYTTLEDLKAEYL